MTPEKIVEDLKKLPNYKEVRLLLFRDQMSTYGKKGGNARFGSNPELASQIGKLGGRGRKRHGKDK